MSIQRACGRLVNSPKVSTQYSHGLNPELLMPITDADRNIETGSGRQWCGVRKLRKEKEGGTTCCVPDPMNLLSNTVSFNLHKLIRLVMSSL